MRFTDNSNLAGESVEIAKKAVDTALNTMQNEIDGVKDRLNSVESAQAAAASAITTDDVHAENVHADNVYTKSLSVENDASIQGKVNANEVEASKIKSTDKITAKDIAFTGKVTGNEVDVTKLTANEIEAANIHIDEFAVDDLTAGEVDATKVEANEVEVTSLEATTADVATENVQTLNVTDKATVKDADFTGHVTEKNTEIETLRVTDKAVVKAAEFETVKTGLIYIQPKNIQVVPENGWFHISHINQGVFLLYLSSYTDDITDTDSMGDVMFCAKLEYRNHNKKSSVKLSYAQKELAFEHIYIDANGEIWLKRGSAISDSRRIIVFAESESELIYDTWGENAAEIDISDAKDIEMETGNETIHVGEFYQDGNVVIHGNMKVEGVIEISGLEAEHAEYLGISEKVTADEDGNLSVDGNASITGDATIGGDTSIEGDLKVTGRLDASVNTYNFTVYNNATFEEFKSTWVSRNVNVLFKKNEDVATARQYDFSSIIDIISARLIADNENSNIIGIVVSTQELYALQGMENFDIFSAENTDILTLKGNSYKNCHFYCETKTSGVYNVKDCIFSKIRFDAYSHDFYNCVFSSLSTGDIYANGFHNCKITENTIANIYIQESFVDNILPKNNVAIFARNSNIIISGSNEINGLRIFAKKISVEQASLTDSYINVNYIRGSDRAFESSTPNYNCYIFNCQIEIKRPTNGFEENVFEGGHYKNCHIFYSGSRMESTYNFFYKCRFFECQFYIPNSGDFFVGYVQSWLYNCEVYLQRYLYGTGFIFSDCELVSNKIYLRNNVFDASSPFKIAEGVFDSGNTRNLNKIFSNNLIQIIANYGAKPPAGSISLTGLHGCINNVLRINDSQTYSASLSLSDYFTGNYVEIDSSTTAAGTGISAGNNQIAKGK